MLELRRFWLSIGLGAFLTISLMAAAFAVDSKKLSCGLVWQGCLLMQKEVAARTSSGFNEGTPADPLFFVFYVLVFGIPIYSAVIYFILYLIAKFKK
ncbi:MAG TPA: hypothetical protein VGC87_03405 [Pyrinomonadaceae bacterium]|jgi:hypothetical protein